MTLCQDNDLAHTSKAPDLWAKKHNIPLILPRVLPDFSILETMARPLTRAFNARRRASGKAASGLFSRISEEEMDENQIQGLYS